MPMAQGVYVDPFHDLVVPENEIESLSRVTISKVEAIQDIWTLERIVRRGYAGYDFYQAKGVNWDKFFTDTRNEISKMDDQIKVKDFYHFLFKKLGFINDSHLGLYIIFDGKQYYADNVFAHKFAFTSDLIFERSQDVWKVLDDRNKKHPIPKGTQLSYCEGVSLDQLLVPAATLVDNELTFAWMARVFSESKPKQPKCRFMLPDGQKKTYVLDLHHFNVGGYNRDKGPVFQFARTNHPYIRLKSFAEESAAELEKFVATSNELKNEKMIAVDLRGNGGGNAKYVLEWMSELGADRLKYFESSKLVSEVTMQGIHNYLQFQRTFKEYDDIGSKNINHQNQLHFLQMDSIAKKQNGVPFRKWDVVRKKLKANTDGDFKGSLVVMTDAFCGSACEVFVHMAKKLPNTVVIGENTRGAVTFPNPWLYRLPKSRLWISFGGVHFKADLPGAGCKEGTGFIPDLWIDTDFAVNMQQQIIGCMVDGECSSKLTKFIKDSKTITDHQFVERPVKAADNIVAGLF